MSENEQSIESIRTVDQAEEHIQKAHETLEDLVREQERVEDQKSASMKRFNEELKGIQARMAGQLRVLDELRDRRDYVEKQPDLPFDQKPADGSGEVVPAQDGSVHAGEEMFATAGTPLEGEGDDTGEPSNVVPLREESFSSESFMADGTEPTAEEQESLHLDADEIEMLTKGDAVTAKQVFVLRTGAEDAVADAEIKAWQAAQQGPAEKPRRGRKARS